MLEEAENASGEAFPSAHDQGVGAELGFDLRDQLLDAAPAEDPYPFRLAAAATKARAGLAPERLQQVAGCAHHAWITPTVSTLIPGAISL